MLTDHENQDHLTPNALRTNWKDKSHPTLNFELCLGKEETGNEEGHNSASLRKTGWPKARASLAGGQDPKGNMSDPLGIPSPFS